MSYDDMNEARNLINDLYLTLKELLEKDPDQEIWTYAYGPIDAALRLGASYFEGHPVVKEIRDLFSPEAAAEGAGPARAADVLPVVSTLRSLLNSRVSRMAHQINEEARLASLPPYLR